MRYPLSVCLSVPNLQDRYDDYVEDLAAGVPGHWVATADGPHRLRVVLEGDEPTRGLLGRAVENIRRALPRSVLQYVGPDELQLDQIAAMLSLPSACLRELQRENPETFPRPLAGASDCFHLAHVLSWVRAAGGIEVDDDLLDMALTALNTNMALHARRLG